MGDWKLCAKGEWINGIIWSFIWKKKKKLKSASVFWRSDGKYWGWRNCQRGAGGYLKWQGRAKNLWYGGYYQELKARIAATHQPVSTVAQEELAEEPLVEENVTSETHEDQAAGEESPVVFEPVQTEASPQEVSPLADETETELLKKWKLKREVTENGEEADGANTSEMKEEPPIAFPSSEAELVEGARQKRRLQN